MDIENTWQQNSGTDDALNKLLQQNDFDNLHSRLPLKKLKNNLLTGIAWAVIITAGYISLLFFIAIWQVYIAISILMIVNTWTMIDSWRLYKNTNDTISPSFSLKQELEENYNSFQKWWSIQQRTSLFVYPIAVSGGFIMGGFLGSGKPVEEFLYNAKMLLILGITILVVVPVCYYSAKWMFNYTYGKHLKKIKTFISELS